MVGDPKSKLLKVAALNLFHPTAFPLFPKSPYFDIATQFQEGAVKGLNVNLPCSCIKFGARVH
jgi:hypothetical protein